MVVPYIRELESVMLLVHNYKKVTLLIGQRPLQTCKADSDM